MNSATVEAILAEDKKARLIQSYLQQKKLLASDTPFNPLHYTALAQALDFYHQLNCDNLNLLALASTNEETRKLHAHQLETLVQYLDQVVTFNSDTPPKATAFDAKKAITIGLDLNQHLSSRSLRSLHAQHNNLGIAEKMLDANLGPQEWLSDVDIERALIKYGVKDRVHVTRLNSEDIGMILHFERQKHNGDEPAAPYSIPLILNGGTGSSLASQGSHWTHAMITVNPLTDTISIDYEDSMRLNNTEREILTAAINYQDDDFQAFPTYANQQVNAVGREQQRDGWSCGYRALRGLLASEAFPTEVQDADNQALQTLIATEVSSNLLRDAVYANLLADLEVGNDYFVAMKLHDDMLTESSKENTKVVDKEYTAYLLKAAQKTHSAPAISSNQFDKQYQQISQAWSKQHFTTDRETTTLKTAITQIQEDSQRSSDAKLFAMLNAITRQYQSILASRGGSNSRYGKQLATFAKEHYGVSLSKSGMIFDKSGLFFAMLNHGQKSPSLLASKPLPLSTESTVINTQVLRNNDELSRLGTLFGQQFCFAEKPGGVEPGFRAIDCDEEFFNKLSGILASKASNETFQQLHKSLEASLPLATKQQRFAAFIKHLTPKPHAKDKLNAHVAELCDAIKEAVKDDKAGKLSAWMYKLDYAEGKKNRQIANKEALREFVGTRLAGIFSQHNQKQQIEWVQGKTGAHAILACGWKNGLQELKTFLHGGESPAWNGVFVNDKTASVKQSKVIPGLGKNLILGIALGDRDGMGKDAQNKGFADGRFYGFDYGKPYEGEGVSSSLRDDFSFEDKAAKMPSFLRSSGTLGVARHYMYRNYSTFYDTALSERMEGVHMLNKMITGQDPSLAVLQSYPELAKQLAHIEQSTPSMQQLFNQLKSLSLNTSDQSLAASINDMLLQVSANLLPFELYFMAIKIDLINQARQQNIPATEIIDYLTFIDKMAHTATQSNANILRVFEQRLQLTKAEVDFLDQLEKTVSPTSGLSHSQDVLLNHLRFDPQEKRIAFNLILNKDDTYTLSTDNAEVLSTLKEKLDITLEKNAPSYSVMLSKSQLNALMQRTEKLYDDKKQQIQIKPRIEWQSLPQMRKWLRADTLKETWLSDGSLDIRLTHLTHQQIEGLSQLFTISPYTKPGGAVTLTIKRHQLAEFVAKINTITAPKVALTQPATPSHKTMPSDLTIHSMLNTPHKQSITMSHEPTIHEAFLSRMKKILTNTSLYSLELESAVGDLIAPQVKTLMQHNDETLRDPANIQRIIDDDLSAIIKHESTTPSSQTSQGPRHDSDFTM